MSDTEIQENKKNSNGAYIAVIIILLLALAFMAYLWSSKNSELTDCQNANKALKADMNGMNEMLSGYVGTMSNDLKTDFRNMLATYDKLIEKDASKADSINAQKERINGLLDELENNKKLTGYQIMKLRQENETLRDIMKGYVYQIDSLNTANYQLRSDLQTTTSELNSTTEERDQYKDQSEQLSEQVKKGSKLHAYNFTTVGLKEKLNSTMTETNRARSVVQIKSTFTLSKNLITPAGEKMVYMQIIDPSGKTMQRSTGDVVDTDAGKVPYSDKKSIDYQNTSVDMSIYFSLRNLTATKGNYKVNIYCQGQLIGSDSFTLK